MSRKTLAILLFVSLALNVFMVGAVVGGLVVGQKFRADRPAMARGGQPLWAAANTLPPEQRRAYRKLLRGEAGEVRDGMREARAARAQAWRQLGAEPFDPAATRASLGVARAREAQVRADVEGRIVDFAAGLPSAERARLAQGLADSQPSRRAMPPQRPDRP